MTDNIARDVAMALDDAADRIAAENPDNAAAVRRFIRGHAITFTDNDGRSATEFLAGYMQAVHWLRTSPPTTEADEVVDLYKMHRPGGTHEEGTIYVDADKVPSLVAFLGSAVEVEDGVTLKAEFVRDYGEHLKTTFNPPARTFAWPALHRWYEGFELAVWHAVRD